MKYLYLILLALATCSLKMGGWNEIKDFEQSNDVRINEAIQKATDDFLIRINSMNRDAFDIRPIGVYTQLVAGTNYKVILATNTFIPGRHDLAIHEYTYTLDPVWSNSNGERNWNDEFNRYNDKYLRIISIQKDDYFGKAHYEYVTEDILRDTIKNYL